MVLLILGVLGAIGLRLVRHRQVQELSAGGGIDYRQPNLDRVQITIPGRPHFIPNLVHAPDTIEKRVTFTFSTNSHGFRGRDYAVPKPEGTYRIACVGECVTLGNGVSDGEEYPAVLQGMLDERWPDRGYEVVNISANVDARDVFALLSGEAVPASPDVVVYSPGAETVFLAEHVGTSPFRLFVDPETYERSQSAYRGHMQSALDLSRRHGFRLVLVTPTVNTFLYPDVEHWIDEVVSFGRMHGIPVLDSASLFQAREAQDGLVLEYGDETQQMVRYRDGVGEVLVEAANGPDYYVAPEVYAYLDDHRKVAPLLSIDENHPNPLGHQLLAEEVLKILEQRGLLEAQQPGVRKDAPPPQPAGDRRP